MENARVVKQEPIYDQVYNILRDAIVNAGIKPGDRLVETRLSNQLGVSRTPIREAFQRLLQEGILVSIPGAGVFVFNPSAQEITELYDCRIALEGMAAAKASLRIDDKTLTELDRSLREAEDYFGAGDLDQVPELNVRFHNLFVAASGNNRIVKMMQDLKVPLSQYRAVNLHLRGREILEEHRQIFEAIRAHDPAQSETVVRRHLENDKATVLLRMPHPQG